jgi:predicted phosphodiesterase
MRFQIASDIHIEKYYPKKMEIIDFIVPDSSVDFLILAGDIGSIYQTEHLLHFFSSCKKFFHRVIFVPGNNEYYLRDGFFPKSMKELDEIVEHVCNEADILLLNNAYIESETHIIFGSSWWSFIPDVLTMKIFQNDAVTPITPNDFNSMHLVCRKSLDKVIHENQGKKELVVITHYCPTKLGTMNNHHKKDDFKSLIPYYFSSSERYLTRKNISVWIFGHTHVFRDFYFCSNETRIISNADPRKKFFQKQFVITI